LPFGKKLKNAKWNLSLTTLDLDKIKRIRNATNAHFNIICSMLQVDALRTHFLESRKVKNVSHLPKWIWVPFPTGWPGHPAMTNEGGEDTMTNHLYEIELLEHNGLQETCNSSHVPHEISF
jgi:hypothetical protein